MAMSPGRNYPGSSQRLDIRFTDDLGNLTDPATVTFRTCDPCGTKAQYVYGTDAALQRARMGEYLIDFTPTVSGRWVWRWEAVGIGVPYAKEGTFVVQASPFYGDSFTQDYPL